MHTDLIYYSLFYNFKKKRKKKKERGVTLIDLYVLSVEVEMIGDEETKAGRVQVGAGADDAVGGETREFPSDVGENVDGVGNEEENGVGGVTDERRNDGAEEGEVPLEEVEA